MQPKKLEHYKFFQPFAWTLCILFATFVGLLAINLNNSINQLQESRLDTEKRIQDLEEAIQTNNHQKAI